MYKKIGIGVLAVLSVLVVVNYFIKMDSTKEKEFVSEDIAQGQQFSQAPFSLDGITYTKHILPVAHRFIKSEMSPFIGSALLDIDNDGKEELFIGGGDSQNDAWYQYQGAGLVDITDQVTWKKSSQKATYAAAVVDYDTDGDGDIFVARVDGVFYYENQRGESFLEEKKIEAFLEEKAVPTGLTLGDVNKDGMMDMFVSTYLRHDFIEGATIFNREDHGTISQLLLGQGNLIFQEQTEESGLLYRHNTFSGSFVDLDNDSDLDLAVAYDTGSVRLYHNDGTGHFARIENTPWENKYGYPMGIGVGDINNDSLVDLFFSNTGQSLPEPILRGDLKKDQELFTNWTLYQNQGEKNFTEQSRRLDLDKHEFAWGGVLTDINLDGREDLLVSENYVKIPQQRVKPLPGRVFFQDERGRFLSQEKTLGIENPRFSLSSLATDWNSDGVQDIVWINIDGESQVYLSQAEVSEKTARIQVPYESRFLGTRWRVTFADDKSLSWHYTPTEGLGSNQTRTWFLPKGLPVRGVEIIFPDGSKEDGKKYQAM